MPAAVATGVQIAGPLKNKKIVFNDEGEAVAKPKWEKHNKKAPTNKPQNTKSATNGQVKKMQRIKFSEDGDAEEEEVKFNKHKSEPAKKGNHLIFNNENTAKKPQRIKFNEDGEEKEQGSDSESENEAHVAAPKKRNNKQFQMDDYDPQKKWYQVASINIKIKIFEYII